MRKYFCLLTLLLLNFTAYAQADTLVSFNLKQAEILQTGMLVLGGWAILNIIIGSFKLTKASRSRKYFFQMSLYWNIANLCIAGAALYFMMSEDAAVRHLRYSVYLHELFKKILYLNAGLAVAWLFLGANLKERSRNSPKMEQLLGWGNAIVLQGWVLFLISLALIVLLEVEAPQLFRLINTG